MTGFTICHFVQKHPFCYAMYNLQTHFVNLQTQQPNIVVNTLLLPPLPEEKEKEENGEVKEREKERFREKLYRKGRFGSFAIIPLFLLGAKFKLSFSNEISIFKKEKKTNLTSSFEYKKHVDSLHASHCTHRYEIVTTILFKKSFLYLLMSCCCLNCLFSI